jgi:hypothetical protein
MRDNPLYVSLERTRTKSYTNIINDRKVYDTHLCLLVLLAPGHRLDIPSYTAASPEVLVSKPLSTSQPSFLTPPLFFFSPKRTLSRVMFLWREGNPKNPINIFDDRK